MPSMEEARRQVKESLEKQTTVSDHDNILKSLQDEIDKHNAIKDETQRSMKRSRRQHDKDQDSRSVPSLKFRFKSGISDPVKRRHHSRDGRQSRREKKRRHEESSRTDEASHPFPREPADFDHAQMNSADAFRESLFDALADDEGAQYWEGIYNQPIHVYSRPTVQNEKGELEEMNDDEYAAYVKTKMWEKKNPHIVLERERSERKKREEEEEKSRQREEFVRRKEQAAWERAQHGEGHKGRRRGSDGNYVFTEQTNNTAQSKKDERKEYAATWERYSKAWDALKHEPVHESNGESSKTTATTASKRIPWPVFAAKPVLKANIEDFMKNPPLADGQSLLQVLKLERVRWHPDKVQQRFRGAVDEGTMKLVTGVFQVVDGLVDEERKRNELM